MSLDVNITYFFILVQFIIIAAILNTVVFRPFLALFQERYEAMEGAVERAEGLLDQASKQEAQFAKKIRSATALGIERRNAIRVEAQQKMNARVGEERERLQAKLDTQLAELDSLRKTAMADVHVQAEQLAELTAGKLLKRKI